MPRPKKPKAPPQITFVSLKFNTAGMTSAEIAEYTEHYHAALKARSDIAPDCRIFLHTYDDPSDTEYYSSYHVVATRDSDSLSVWLARDLLPPLFRLRRAAMGRSAALNAKEGER